MKENDMIRPDDRADCIERITDDITSAYETWPPGHPAHHLIPGYLAREISEQFISEPDATAEEQADIIRQAFAAAGRSEAPVDAVVAMVQSDPTFLIPA
jgi:hypothetical protein